MIDQLESEITDSDEEEPAEEVATLNPLEEKEAEMAELKDKYIRLMAEFENYKRRTIREKMDLLSTAAQDTLAALLPILDDFDRAKATAEDENSKEPFSEGVLLVYNKLYATLQQRGLKPMETNGSNFDPEWHEAITENSLPPPTI